MHSSNYFETSYEIASFSRIRSETLFFNFSFSSKSEILISSYKTLSSSTYTFVGLETILFTFLIFVARGFDFDEFPSTDLNGLSELETSVSPWKSKEDLNGTRTRYLAILM